MLAELTVQTNERTNNMYKKAYSTNNRAKVEFGSFGGGHDGEHNGGGLVQISKIFVTLDDFFHGAMQLNTVYLIIDFRHAEGQNNTQDLYNNFFSM